MGFEPTVLTSERPQTYTLDRAASGIGSHEGEFTLVMLPRTVTLYRDSVNGTRDHVTYQKLVTR
jgi:hypothetical protein